MNDDECEPDWSEGQDMEKTEQTANGVTIHINPYAMERIESAAAAGVRQELARRLDKIISDTIAEVVETKLNDAVGAVAEKAVMDYLTKPRPRTNAYGEAVGGGTRTISDQIPEKVEAWMTQRVNARGEPDSYHSRENATRIDFIVGKFVRDELDVSTKKAAAEVTEKARKVVSAHVGRFVAEQMIPQIELNGDAA